MKTKQIKYRGKKIEVGIEDEQKGKIFSDIEIPECWKLWTHQMCIDFHNDEKLRRELFLKDCWFFVEQPFDFNKNKGYIARFGAYSGWVGLDCYGYPQNSNSGLGVRFYREVE